MGRSEAAGRALNDAIDMSNFELEKFDTPDELARAAARAWLSGIRSRGTGAYTVALSGGRIAARFFAALADLAAAEREILSGVHFFWGDERCVGPTDSASNFCLANTHL